MNLNHYIFITDEGFTFQPNNDELGEGIDNLQVIGYSDGATPLEAFKNLVNDDNCLVDTTFNELKCYQLRTVEPIAYFNLKD